MTRDDVALALKTLAEADPLDLIGDGAEVTDYVRILWDLKDGMTSLKLLIDAVEAETVEVIPGVIDVPGIGRVTVKAGANRKGWDHEGLTRQVTARLADDPHLLADEDGELRPPADIVARVIEGWADCASPSWKVGATKDAEGNVLNGLRGLGIDLEDYVTTTHGAKKVVLV